MARKSSISEERKGAIIREVSDGGAVAAVAKKHGISAATLYLWVRSKKGAKKKVRKKTKKMAKKMAKKVRRTEPAVRGEFDLPSMVEDISMGRKFKEFLAELGYSRR